MKIFTLLLSLSICTACFSQINTSFYFEQEMESIQKDGNSYQISFEKLIKKEGEINVEIYTTPLQNRSYYYQQIFGHFSKHFGDKLNLKIYCALPNAKEINSMLPSRKKEALRLLTFEKHFKNKYENYLIERSQQTFPVNFPFMSKNYDLITTLKKVQVSKEEIEQYFDQPKLIEELNSRNKVATKKLDSLKQKYALYIENQDSLFSKNDDFDYVNQLIPMPRYFLQASLDNTDLNNPSDTIDSFTRFVLENPILVILNGKPFHFSPWFVLTNNYETRERYIKSKWNCPSGEFFEAYKEKTKQVKFHVLADPIEYDIYPLDLETKITHNQKVLYHQNQKFDMLFDSSIEVKNLSLGDSIEIYATIEKKGYHKECPNFYKKIKFHCPQIEFNKRIKFRNKNRVSFSIDKGIDIESRIRNQLKYQLNLDISLYKNDVIVDTLHRESKTNSLGGNINFSIPPEVDKICMTGKILREVNGQIEEAPIDQNNCKGYINRCFDLKNLKNNDQKN